MFSNSCPRKKDWLTEVKNYELREWNTVKKLKTQLLWTLKSNWVFSCLFFFWKSIYFSISFDVSLVLINKEEWKYHHLEKKAELERVQELWIKLETDRMRMKSVHSAIIKIYVRSKNVILNLSLITSKFLTYTYVDLFSISNQILNFPITIWLLQVAKKGWIQI